MMRRVVEHVHDQNPVRERSRDAVGLARVGRRFAQPVTVHGFGPREDPPVPFLSLAPQLPESREELDS